MIKIIEDEPYWTFSLDLGFHQDRCLIYRAWQGEDCKPKFAWIAASMKELFGARR